MTTEVIPTSKAPKRIPFELVRKVAGEGDPVVIATKRMNKTTEVVYFDKMKPMPRAYFINAIIKEEFTVKRYLLGLIPWGTKTKTKYFARCNEYWSEALTSLTETIPKFSQELSNLLLADDEKQHIEAVIGLDKFNLDSTVIKLMLIVVAMSIPFGLFMDTILGLVPAQIVTWMP
jgi:hypothetical protein